MGCGALGRAPAPDGLQLGLEVGQPQVGPVRLVLQCEGAPAIKGIERAGVLERADEGEPAEE